MTLLSSHPDTATSLADRTITATPPPDRVSPSMSISATSRVLPSAGNTPLMRSPFALDFTAAAAADLATALQALSCPARLFMLSLLHTHVGEMRAGEMVAPLGAAQPTVSYHLHVLQHAGLIRRRYDRGYSWCSLHLAALTSLADLLAPEPTSRSAGVNIESALDVTTPFSRTFSPGAATELAPVLKALAYPSRLVIFSLIHSNGAMTEAKITREIGVADTTVGHHVRTLERAKLIHGDQAGTSRWFTLNEPALAGLAKVLRPLKRGVRA